MPALTAALSSVRLTLTEIGEPTAKSWVTKRKGAISGGQGRYAQPKAKLQETVWDKANEAEAEAQFKATFESNLTETKKIHQKYKPKNVTEKIKNADGDWEFEYEGYEGAHFKVVLGPDEMLKSVTGTGLTLKGTQPRDVVGSGKRSKSGNRGTRDREGTPDEEKLYLEASHLIADRFRGTGYKNGCNLATTSAHYNDPVMKDIENKIAKKAEGGQEMKITVSVEWMEYRSAAVVAMLVDDRAGEIGADLTDPAERKALTDLVEKELQERFDRMRSKNIKRVKKVTYSVEVTQADGKVEPCQFETESVDLWA